MADMLAKTKGYLRVDGNHDDVLIGSLITAAKSYLLNAGVKERQVNDLYDLAIVMLVTNWYENREQIVGQTPNALFLGLQSIILQLKASDLNGTD